MLPETSQKGILMLKVIVLLKPYCYRPLTYVFLLVYPVHLAAVLLDSDEDSHGNSNQSIFSNVISQAGGDPLLVRQLSGLLRMLFGCQEVGFRTKIGQLHCSCSLGHLVQARH